MAGGRILTCLLILSTWIAASAEGGDLAEQAQGQWHQFRGPLGTGVAPHGNPPTTWDAETNIRWKVEVPGRGSSTPIIWEDRVFVLTAIETDAIDETKPAPEDQEQRPFDIVFPNALFQFDVHCYSRESGDLLWQKTARRGSPFQGHHPDNDFASASPTTDGERLYVPFGSQGFYCYDLDGNLLWERDLGPVVTRLSFGEGASLKVHDEILIIVRDNEEQSSIYALNALTGDTIWRQDRDEVSAWATPVVVEHGDRTQVITNASQRVRSYDLYTGELIWECGGQVSNVAPSPVVRDGMVICTSGYRGAIAQAISLDAKGDVTDSESVLWEIDRSTPYISSPLLYDDRLYFNGSLNPIWTCVDAESGEIIYGPTRIDRMTRVYASPVAAAGRFYIVDRDGQTFVFEQGGAEFEPISINRLDDPIDASPAIVGDQLFLRGARFLYCIEEDARP